MSKSPAIAAARAWTGLCLAACVLLSAHAQPQGAGGGRRPPPQAAIDACKGMKEGDTAQFNGRNNEKVQGSCRRIGEVLAVVPAGGPPKDHDGGPAGGKPTEPPKK
jgi:hypothetical protein